MHLQAPLNMKKEQMALLCHCESPIARGAKRRGRNGEVLFFPALLRQAKTDVANGAIGARLRVWFWTPMEQRMVA